MSQLFVDNIKNRTGGAIGAPSGAVVIGVVTATSFDGPLTGNITGVAATFTGNVSIGGTLTYEDVTNIDSIGIVTARSGVRVNAGGLVVTAGVSTLAADLSIADKIIHTGDTNTAIRFPAVDTFTVETAGSERLRVLADGTVSSGTLASTPATIAAGSLVLTNANAGFFSNNGGDAKFGSAASNNVLLQTNGIERLRITSAGAAIFKFGLAEKYENAGTTLGAQTANPLSDGNVILFTGNESGNLTINFTGVHTTISSGETVSFTAILTPNNSGKITVVQVDGQTPAGGLKWSGGSAPSAGSSGQDIYTFQILKTGSANTSYTVFGAATNYA
jgi:hypothetical protein